MKPSSGITTSRSEQGKSLKPYYKGIELDFYPDFVCRKPKLKWNLTKFDSTQQIAGLNLSIATARNTHTSGLLPRGKSISLTTNKLWLTPQTFPDPSLSQTPSEEKPSTRTA